MASPPTAPTNLAVSPASEVLVDQARLLLANMPALLVGNVVTSAITAVALWLGGQGGPALLAWFGANLALVAFGAWRARALQRRPLHPGNALRRLRSYTPGMAIIGLVWGVAVAAYWARVPVELQLVLMVTASGSATGALHAFVAWLPGFLAFFVPVVGGLIVGCLLHGGVASWAIAASAIGYAVYNARFAVLMHASLLEALHAKHAMAAMATDLQAQKERAEQASAAKSRFLAAASHDLRQPVHALSLMVGALRAQPPGPDATRMLARLDATVNTMGGMFNALLDMSRLDAGMVHVDAQAVDVHGLVERLAAEVAVVAEGRGLRLGVCAADGPLWVHTDPLLLERILRNLLANAVRYTDRGGIRIRLARQRGRALIRVIDSGLGIAADQHEAVFEEFTQLHNPERDRNKGLGLGLAIVRRLCELLRIELSLRSAPGRGSVFTMKLALADGPGCTVLSTKVPTSHAQPGSRVQPGDLVLVVDDDPDILAGMRALLTGWGCQVVDANGLDDLLPQLLTLNATPRLIICDYRLRAGLTGMQVVARLRHEFNDDLPAILITGDTAPDRLLEAAASGLALLHKPVRADELEAALGRVLAASKESLGSAGAGPPQGGRTPPWGQERSDVGADISAGAGPPQGG